jgi:hypothetical protein
VHNAFVYKSEFSLTTATTTNVRFSCLSSNNYAHKLDGVGQAHLAVGMSVKHILASGHRCGLNPSGHGVREL